MKTLAECLTDPERLVALNAERNELLKQAKLIRRRVLEIQTHMAACFTAPEGTRLATPYGPMATRNPPQWDRWSDDAAILAPGYMLRKGGSVGKRDAYARASLADLVPEKPEQRIGDGIGF